jgi:serine protease Do
MERIVLRHLKGSKASQREEFPLDTHRTLTFGRDPSCEVRFDPDRDDLVGRQHARITRDGGDGTRFVLSDLASRNGTFVNKVRLMGEHVLTPGDVIQLGAGGPEMEFDLDPRPAGSVKATRIGSFEVVETRLGAPAIGMAAGAASGSASGSSSGSASGSASGASGPNAAKGNAAPGAVGKATVERLIGETRSQSQRNMLLGMAGVLVVALGVVGFNRWQTSRDVASGNAAAASGLDSLRREGSRANALSQQLQPAEIAARNAPAIVQVDFSWKLTYRGTGGQVYHRLVPNEYRYKGQKRRILDNGQDVVPAYVQMQGGLEPALTLDQYAGRPIGVSSRGSGFVVSETGFILTNRHVAYNWQTWYRFDPEDVGPIIDPGTGAPQLDANGQPVLTRPPQQWIPSETRQAGPKGDIGDFQARVEYLYVRFPKDPTPFEASNVRPSQRHDVALIKVDAPQSLPFVTMSDTYDQTRQGDAVTVMGYPGVSEEVITVIKSRDMFNREMQQRTLPDPTLSAGNIGKILRAADAEVRDGFMTYAPSGDTYQLTINSTGGGNSGGPMFDVSGNVVGIYFAGKTADVQVSFAIPIRYGMELLRIGDPTTQR